MLEPGWQKSEIKANISGFSPRGSPPPSVGQATCHSSWWAAYLETEFSPRRRKAVNAPVCTHEAKRHSWGVTQLDLSFTQSEDPTPLTVIASWMLPAESSIVSDNKSSVSHGYLLMRSSGAGWDGRDGGAKTTDGKKDIKQWVTDGMRGETQTL